MRLPVEGDDEIARLGHVVQRDDGRARLLPRPAAAAHRRRRARAAHPAHLAAHQHRTAGAQRGDGPGDPAGGPAGRCWRRCKAQIDGAGHADRRPPGARPRRRRSPAPSRWSRCTRSSTAPLGARPAARPRPDDRRPTSSPWYVRGEPAALERAIINLLDNAVKFSPPGGTIEVAPERRRADRRDHGPGIPAEELPHVFDRFWRSPSARALPGSGLGLSIVARTVQQSGGKIALAPAEGGGTRPPSACRARPRRRPSCEDTLLVPRYETSVSNSGAGGILACTIHREGRRAVCGAGSCWGWGPPLRRRPVRSSTGCRTWRTSCGGREGLTLTQVGRAGGVPDGGARAGAVRVGGRRGPVGGAGGDRRRGSAGPPGRSPGPRGGRTGRSRSGRCSWWPGPRGRRCTRRAGGWSWGGSAGSSAGSPWGSGRPRPAGHGRGRAGHAAAGERARADAGRSASWRCCAG